MKNDVREHVLMIFKALQMQTGQAVEFQEAAYAQAIEYLKGYNWQFTSHFSKNLSAYAAAQAPQAMMADADLFAIILDFSYGEQAQAQAQVAELIDRGLRLEASDYDRAFNEAYEEISKEVFEGFPLYHTGRKEAEEYAKENGKVVFKDGSGYFTACEGYVPPPVLKFDDEDIGF